MANPLRKTSIAALAAALPAAGQPVQLLPAGAFRSADGTGRPADAPYWKLDAAAAEPQPWPPPNVDGLL